MKSSPAEHRDEMGTRGDRFTGPTYDPRHPGLRASWQKNRSREVSTMQEKTEKTTETREVTDAPGADDASKGNAGDKPATTGDDKDK